jgi:hypothetical protein
MMRLGASNDSVRILVLPLCPDSESDASLALKRSSARFDASFVMPPQPYAQTDNFAARHLRVPANIESMATVLGDVSFTSARSVVQVKIASIGRDPREAPAHALLVSVNPGQRSPRNGCQCHIAMIEMNWDTVEIVSPESMTCTPLPNRGATNDALLSGHIHMRST